MRKLSKGAGCILYGSITYYNLFIAMGSAVRVVVVLAEPSGCCDFTTCPESGCHVSWVTAIMDSDLADPGRVQSLVICSCIEQPRARYPLVSLEASGSHSCPHPIVRFLSAQVGMSQSQ